MKKYIILLIIIFIFSCAKKQREWNNPVDPDYIGAVPLNVQSLIGTWTITSGKVNGANLEGSYTVTSIGGTIQFTPTQINFNVQWAESGTPKTLSGSGNYELIGPLLSAVFNNLSDYTQSKNMGYTATRQLA